MLYTIAQMKAVERALMDMLDRHDKGRIHLGEGFSASDAKDALTRVRKSLSDRQSRVKEKAQ
jgi:hypothetical protein